MQPCTIATLEELRAANWFQNVGKKDLKLASVVSDWEEALRHCASVKWENLTLAAANQLRRQIGERSYERYQRCNEIVDEMKQHFMPLVVEKCEEIVKRHNLPKVFIDCVNWDILHLCMECEYADLVPPAFFAAQAYWYVVGHFPCGWEGDYSQGKIIVY